MKNLKKHLSLCLIISILFAGNSYSESLADLKTDSKTDSKIVAFAVENGIAIPLNEHNYNLYLNENKKRQINDTTEKKSSISSRNAGMWETFIQNSSYSELSPSKATYVTPFVKGPATISYGDSVEISGEATISLSPTKKFTIGGTWTASTTKNFNVSFNVPDGKNMRVQFTPKMLVRNGEYRYYVDDTVVRSENITVYQPIKVNGFCDGLYELTY